VTVSCIASERHAVHWWRPPNALSAKALFAGLFEPADAAFWLHSASLRPGISRYSFMGSAAASGHSIIRYTSRPRELRIVGDGCEFTCRESLFSYLQNEIRRRACSDAELPFDFCGGFVGYFGYELKQECGSAVVHPSAFPDAAFPEAEFEESMLKAKALPQAVALAGLDVEVLHERIP
jgi:para-aminobenzoate synthetase